MSLMSAPRESSDGAKARNSNLVQPVHITDEETGDQKRGMSNTTSCGQSESEPGTLGFEAQALLCPLPGIWSETKLTEEESLSSTCSSHPGLACFG